MLSKQAVRAMLRELSLFRFDGIIMMEIFTVDGHFVTKKRYNSVTEARSFLSAVKSHQRITLTIR